MGVAGTMNEKLRLESVRATRKIRSFPWEKVKISFSDLKKGVKTTRNIMAEIHVREGIDAGVMGHNM